MQQQEQEEVHIFIDRDAATALYDRHAQSIFRYIRMYTTSTASTISMVSREDAEDLLLEVFMAAFENHHLSGLSEKEQLSWLRRVAYNKLVDIYRHSSRHPSIPLDEMGETIYDDERGSPENITLRQEAYGQLHKAISMLSSPQQRVLRLRFGSGLRFSEIAVLLNKREEAVRKLFSRTLASLRTIYSQGEEKDHRGSE